MVLIVSGTWDMLSGHLCMFVLPRFADMIVHPDFLQRILGHFYYQTSEGKWVRKEKAAFIQTPQVTAEIWV